MTKARFIYLLLIASLFAYFLACVRIPGLDGMSDGGGFLLDLGASSATRACVSQVANGGMTPSWAHVSSAPGAR